tara:strand:+ start:1005 stop:1466 length:462 start_codon:yes stop_codon:yes gene_type:complete
MSNARFGGWSNAGIAAVVTETLPTVGTTRSLVQIRLPVRSRIDSIEAHFSSAGISTTATAAVFRDASGDVPCIGDGPSAATQTLTVGTTTSTDKGVIWSVERDIFAVDGFSTLSDSILNPGLTAEPKTQNLWVGLKVDAGTAVLDRLVVNWRA